MTNKRPTPPLDPELLARVTAIRKTYFSRAEVVRAGFVEGWAVPDYSNLGNGAPAIGTTPDIKIGDLVVVQPSGSLWHQAIVTRVTRTKVYVLYDEFYVPDRPKTFQADRAGYKLGLYIRGDEA